MRFRTDTDSSSQEGKFIFSTPSEYWKLSDSYTLVQAAFLIINVDPAGNEDMEAYDEIDRPNGFTAVLASLDAAVTNGMLESNVKYIDIQGLLAGNMRKITIGTNDLKNWLSSKNFTTGFLFENKNKAVDTPDYLNKNHHNYAYKLAAAIQAWQAVNNDERYKNNGKSPKTNLINFLNTHAAELELLKDNGEPNIKAIEEQISIVANWAPRGGATETPNL